MTKAQASAPGLEGAAGVWTLNSAHGVLTLMKPHGELGFRGTYTLFRDRIKAVTGEDTIEATWVMTGDQLKLANMTFPGCSDRGRYADALASHPWRKTS